MARIWIPLPDRDFEPTEVAVPWRLLTRAGHEVVFATQQGGSTPACDQLLLGSVVFGKLGASAEAKRCYAEMQQAPEFVRPISWRDIEPQSYDGLLIGGGHAQGMRQLLEDDLLRERVLAFWKLHRPVAAVCHGVLVLARATDPATGRSILFGHRTTALAKYLEASAYLLSFWKHGRYYRTYRTYVEDEVRSVLARRSDFRIGPLVVSTPDTVKDDGSGFALVDGRYVSARWPGDAFVFARKFQTLVEARDALLPRPGERQAEALHV